jgi:hypothetical protein
MNPQQTGSDKIIPRCEFHKKFTVTLPDRDEWNRGMVPLKKGGLMWYTDGSKINEGTEAGVYSHGMGQIFSFILRL